MRIVTIIAFALAALLTPAADTPAGVCCPPPPEVAWSPDGSRLAVALPAPGSLLELSADGSTVRTLVAVREGLSSPAWSPDGTRIAFSSGGGIQVWRHIRANLGNESSKGIGPGLEADPRVLEHLE